MTVVNSATLNVGVPCIFSNLFWVYARSGIAGKAVSSEARVTQLIWDEQFVSWYSPELVLQLVETNVR